MLEHVLNHMLNHVPNNKSDFDYGTIVYVYKLVCENDQTTNIQSNIHAIVQLIE